VLEPEEAAQDKLIGTILDGKYRLDSFLSRGGMGAVFRGTHVMLGRPVAVKMINPDLVTSPEIVRRFQREARAATQLKHPNVVDVYDLGQTADGTLYIVMELVAGGSLKDVIRTSGPMDPARIVRILGQVCDGLAQAHRRNIIHRDLKPQNIMLTVDPGGVETAKIVDFGIAKTFEPDSHTQLTATGSTLGTPHYMSPEQVTGSIVDGRSDIYSLGVILYEMLTGEVPFNDPSLPSVLVKHMTEPPQPPSARRPDVHVPPELEAVALRCLAKSPAERFESVEAMAGVLRRALPDRPADQTTIPIGRAGAAAAEAATMPLAAAPTIPSVPAGAAASPAPTVVPPTMVPPPAPPTGPAAAAPPPPPPPMPRVHAAASGPAGVRPAGAAPAAAPRTPETQPTVAASAPPAAVSPAPQVRKGGAGALLALAAAFVVVVAAAGGAYYFVFMRGTPALTSPEQPSEPPPTMPAAGAEAPAAPGGGSPATEAAEAARATGVEPTSPAAPASAPSRMTAGGATTGAARPVGAAARGERAAGEPARPAAQPVATGAVRQGPVAAVPAAPDVPASPSVSFACTGPNEICAPLRAAIQEATSRQGLSLVRSGADIALAARVELLEERVERQFGTTMVVRSYSMDIEGDAARFDESVPMPTAQTVSADTRFGAERFAEAARQAASAAVERVQQYWAKKRQ
jgi:serine/threonine-protein kinase